MSASRLSELVRTAAPSGNPCAQCIQRLKTRLQLIHQVPRHTTSLQFCLTAQRYGEGLISVSCNSFRECQDAINIHAKWRSDSTLRGKRMLCSKQVRPLHFYLLGCSLWCVFVELSWLAERGRDRTSIHVRGADFEVTPVDLCLICLSVET